MKRILSIILFTCISLSAAVRYQGAGGSDDSTGLSWAKRVLTIQCAVDSMQAGDTVYLEGRTITTKINVDMHGTVHSSPTITNPIYIIGCNSSGVALTDTNMATITTASTISCLCSLSTASDYLRFRNIKWDGGGNGKATNCITGAALDGPDGLTFQNCRITNASVHGVAYRVGTTIGLPWTFTRCRIDNNGKSGTGNGVQVFSSTRAQARFEFCRVDNNDSIGVCAGGSGTQTIISCLFYNNGIAGFMNLAASEVVIVNNTFYNNKTALNIFQNSVILAFINNIGSSNATAFINTNTSNLTYWKAMTIMNNDSYNNGAIIDINGGVMPGVGNITTNPKFVSTTGGSEDFNLQSDSPCKNTGIGVMGY